MYSAKKNLHQNSPLTTDELLSRMENYCAYRERCPKEVRDKLLELGASGADARQIFDVLKTDKFFDENRFAVAYAGGKFRNNHWGKVRIRLELRIRAIAPDIIEQALGTIEMEEYDSLIRKLLQKKLLQYQGDEKSREKTAASLIRSGFEPELVFRNLNKISR